MSYSEANNLLSALEITNVDGNFEIALEVINKYGNYKRALQATIGIEFKKKEALLIALLGTEDEVDKNEHDSEAKRLINLVREINSKVFQDSQKLKIQFNILIDNIKLDEMISDRDLCTLNSIKPYCKAKLLISNINAYQDGYIQLEAFIQALKNKPSDTLQISNAMDRLQIKRR